MPTIDQPPVLGPDSQRGVTLIEVLVAVVILAFGLIGLAGLQTTAITSNQLSMQYTQVSNLAQNLSERMRANRDAVFANSYNMAAGVPGSPTVNCGTTVCTSAQQAAWDLAVWYASLSSATSFSNVPTTTSANLNSVQVAVGCATTCVSDSVRLITIYWNPDRGTATGLGCDASTSSDKRCYRLPFVP